MMCIYNRKSLRKWPISIIIIILSIIIIIIVSINILFSTIIISTIRLLTIIQHLIRPYRFRCCAANFKIETRNQEKMFLLFNFKPSENRINYFCFRSSLVFLLRSMQYYRSRVPHSSNWIMHHHNLQGHSPNRIIHYPHHRGHSSNWIIHHRNFNVKMHAQSCLHFVDHQDFDDQVRVYQCWASSMIYEGDLSGSRTISPWTISPRTISPRTTSPRTTSPGQYPPGQYPPGQYPPGQYPPSTVPPTLTLTLNPNTYPNPNSNSNLTLT